MPGFNGSGTFIRGDGTRTGSTTWNQAENAGIGIVSVGHDTHDQYIADGLSTCICKDGQTTISANIPFNSKLITGLGAGVSATDAGNLGQIQSGSLCWGGTSGGGANAHTLTLSPAITSYVTGLKVHFLSGFTNTAAATLNINGLGAKNIKKIDGYFNITDIRKADICLGGIYVVIYDGTQFLLINPNQCPLFTEVVVATGSVQGDAASITAYMAVITGADGTKGVILPTAPIGSFRFICNQAASTLKVYPPSGWSYAALGANASFNLVGNASACCFVTAATQYGAINGATIP